VSTTCFCIQGTVSEAQGENVSNVQSDSSLVNRSGGGGGIRRDRCGLARTTPLR
jgi:hypothetical protein